MVISNHTRIRLEERFGQPVVGLCSLYSTSRALPQWYLFLHLSLPRLRIWCNLIFYTDTTSGASRTFRPHAIKPFNCKKEHYCASRRCFVAKAFYLALRCSPLCLIHQRKALPNDSTSGWHRLARSLFHVLFHCTTTSIIQSVTCNGQHMVVFITDPFPENVPAHTLDRRTIAIENGFLAEALVKVNICYIP